MGSDSDWPTMKAAAEALTEFGIASEAKVISAHRDPHGLEEYAGSAGERGLRVIIAGAGGAAHLPGVTAAFTTLPVIGVPIESKSLKGLDSLLSIVQMPPGVPVATVGIGAAQQRRVAGGANSGRRRRTAAKGAGRISNRSSPRNRARKIRISQNKLLARQGMQIPGAKRKSISLEFDSQKIAFRRP